MPRKKVDIFSLFGGRQKFKVPQFSAGAVAKILRLDSWRLQKFLDSPRYNISPSGQLGEGKGSRRWFTAEDIYRIGIATFLVRDGFTPKLIAEILQQMDDNDLMRFDGHGDETSIGIKLSRTGKGPKLSFFRPGRGPDVKVGGDVYYVLDLSEITGEIDRRIEEVTSKKTRR